VMKFEDDDDKDDDDDIGPVTCIHDIRNKCKKTARQSSSY